MRDIVVSEGEAREMAKLVSHSMPLQLEDVDLDTTGLMLLGQELAQMQHLRYLHLSAYEIIYGSVYKTIRIPPLTQLRHLELMLNVALTDAMMADVSLLRNLQTLLLSQEGYEEDPPPTIAVLDLQLMPQLQRVCLINFNCRKVCALQHCQIHARLQDTATREATIIPNNDWSGALDSIQSVLWEQGRSLPLPVPAILAQAMNLTSVALFFDTVGTSGTPLILEGSLAHLRFLLICADTMYVHLPSTLMLEKLHLTTGGELCVTCEDIGAFLDGVHVFRISCGKAVGSFHSDLRVAMYIRRMGVCFDSDAPPFFLYRAWALRQRL